MGGPVFKRKDATEFLDKVLERLSSASAEDRWVMESKTDRVIQYPTCDDAWKDPQLRAEWARGPKSYPGDKKADADCVFIKYAPRDIRVLEKVARGIITSPCSKKDCECPCFPLCACTHEDARLCASCRARATLEQEIVELPWLQKS